MERRILNEIPDVLLTGAEGVRLPNTSNMTLKGVDGETLLMNLDVHGFAVSTGAACSSGNPEPSPVLLAMGLTREEAQSSLRLSLGWENTLGEIDELVDVLKAVVLRLRGFQHGAQFQYGL
jgi:cysteine desulfurase